MMKFIPSAPKSHPRYWSLYHRDLLAYGVKQGITSLQGLTAHGRGEAFDYLIGEKTEKFAQKSIYAASALLLSAKSPVISVNGNTAILVPDDLIILSALIPAQLEVNLFHQSKKREANIAKHLKRRGAKEILLPDTGNIPGIDSNRRITNAKGQQIADVIFVPLEDGDRTGALKQMGKKVITCDLNPMSRTAQTADITIVDNIVRCLPKLIKQIKLYKNKSAKELREIINSYDNMTVLKEALKFMTLRLNKQQA